MTPPKPGRPASPGGIMTSADHDDTERKRSQIAHTADTAGSERKRSWVADTAAFLFGAAAVITAISELFHGN